MFLFFSLDDDDDDDNMIIIIILVNINNLFYCESISDQLHSSPSLPEAGHGNGFCCMFATCRARI